jgi:MFS family permease
VRARVLVLAGLAMGLASFGGSVLGLTLPAISTDFNAPVPALTNLGTVLQLGTLGALPLAMLADRIGRRRMLAVAVAGCSVSALVSAAANTIAVLAAARLAGVCFEALAAGVATALVVEETPADRRALAVSALTFAAGVGMGLTTIVYPLIAPHWRWLYLGAAAALPIAVVLWFGMPESRAFATSRPERGGLRLLLSPGYRGRLALLAAYFVLTIAFLQPAQLFVVLAGSRTLHMSPTELSAVVIASGVVGAGCFALGGWASDRYGRRWPGAALSAATALAAALTFLATTRTGYWAGNVVWSAIASAGAPVLGTWFAELFPTRARATSEACFSVSGAAGAIVGLQLLGAMSPRFGLSTALALGGVVAVAAAGLLLRLPETRGKTLA